MSSKNMMQTMLMTCRLISVSVVLIRSMYSLMVEHCVFIQYMLTPASTKQTHSKPTPPNQPTLHDFNRRSAPSYKQQACRYRREHALLRQQEVIFNTRTRVAPQARAAKTRSPRCCGDPKEPEAHIGAQFRPHQKSPPEHNCFRRATQAVGAHVRGDAAPQ